MVFTIPVDHWVKIKENERQTFESCLRAEKTEKHEDDSDINCYDALERVF